MKAAMEEITLDENRIAAAMPTHSFSCEIEPFKSKFLQATTEAEAFFADVRDLGGMSAWCARAEKKVVVKSVDKVAAGWVCANYSPLNWKRKDFAGSIDSHA
eukprot:1960711-Alexandrium_andersonii.AAC.1